MKNFLIIFFLFASFMLAAQKNRKEKDADEIEKVMSLQEQAWNEGNIEKFMEGYWKSDSLCFVGSNGLTHGWNQTLANYKKNYSDRATMGKLKFTIIENESLGPESRLVIGKWQLERKNEIGGFFTLVWKKIHGKWVIINDHTS